MVSRLPSCSAVPKSWSVANSPASHAAAPVHATANASSRKGEETNASAAPPRI